MLLTCDDEPLIATDEPTTVADRPHVAGAQAVSETAGTRPAPPSTDVTRADAAQWEQTAPSPIPHEVALELVAKELDAAADIKSRTLARLALEMLNGERGRPLGRADATSRTMFARMAGLPRHASYMDRAVGAMLDRLIPLVAHVPGVRMECGPDGEVKPKETVFDVVRSRIEAHLAAGRKIRRMNAVRAADLSWIHVAEIVGRAKTVITSCPLSKAYLAEVATRPGVLGKPHRPRQWDPRKEALYKQLLDWLDRRFEAKLPLPERPTHKSGDPDHAAIRLSVSPDCPDFQLRRGYGERIARHMAAFGVSPEGRRLEGAHTCGDLIDKLKEIRCELQGEASLANLDTALGRVLTARGLSPHEQIPGDLFSDVDGLILKAAAVSKPLSDASRSNLGSLVRFAAKHMGEALRRADDLPRDPAMALHLAILRSRKSMPELEKASEDPETGLRLGIDFLGKLRSSASQLPLKYEPCLLRLENEVFHTGGRIVERFTTRSTLHDIVCSDYFRSLSWEVRRLLPEEAWKLSDEALKPMVEERERKVLKQDRMASKVMSASNAVMAQLPEIPDDAPVLKEIEGFVRYKMCVVPDLMRHFRGRWETAAAKIGRRQLGQLVRFCAMDRSKGGLGKPIETLSLVMVLNWKVVASYLSWMAGRYADVEHDGRKRGPWLTSFDLNAVVTVISMLDPVNGYITQLREEFQPRLVADEEQLPSFSHLEGLRVRMQADTIAEEGLLDREEEFEETFSRAHVDRRIMPPGVVVDAQEEWVKACATTQSRLANLCHYLKRFIDKGRDPLEAIRIPVGSKDPMSFLREILQRAQADLPNRHLKPFEHAIAVRDILLFALLSLTGLRSKNVRQLLYEPGGGGHINLISPDDEEAGGLDALLIRIPWQNFKNLGSWHLFGHDGNKMDYQRRLEDWYNVVPLFQHWVDVCRPYLVRLFAERLRQDADPVVLEAGEVRQTTRALFPIPSLGLMSSDDLTRICHYMTARYHVVDQEGRVRPGRMKFGPHAIRDILATHIIISSEEESRWEIAADLLQTSVEMVKARYVKRTIQERTGRADVHFATASTGMPALQLT